MVTEIWVNIGSGNGLLPDGTKPLPEPILTDHQQSPVTFILGQFNKRHLNHQSLKSVWKLCLEFHSNFPGANELNLFCVVIACNVGWYVFTGNYKCQPASNYNAGRVDNNRISLSAWATFIFGLTVVLINARLVQLVDFILISCHLISQLHIDVISVLDLCNPWCTE